MRGGGVKKNDWPLLGSLESGQYSLGLRFGQNAADFASLLRDISIDEMQRMRA